MFDFTSNPGNCAWTVVIDGNNLAHVLYNLPGRRITPLVDERLAEHLEAWAARHSVWVEICLDRGHSWAQLPERVRAFGADYPCTADDLLVWRVDEHLQRGAACLAITNDEEVGMEARAKGALVWSAWEFVRQPGWDNPRLADPPILPGVIHLAADTTSPVFVKQTNRERRQAHSQKKIRRAESVRRPAYDAMIAHLLEKRQASQVQDGSFDLISGSSQAEKAAFMPILPSVLVDLAKGGNETHAGYVLSFATWPVRQGMRFLRDACCLQHRPLIQSLLDVFDPADFQERDLRALAALLLDICGDEPDFLARGSLMDRARLALLQARGQPLTLDEIARNARLHIPELRRKLNRAVNRWVKLVS